MSIFGGTIFSLPKGPHIHKFFSITGTEGCQRIPWQVAPAGPETVGKPKKGTSQGGLEKLKGAFLNDQP